MPPVGQELSSRPSSDTSHMLARPKPFGEGLARQAPAEGGLSTPTGASGPPHKKSSGVGATVGIVVILVLIVLGALYFWGAYLNKKDSVEQVPFIPGDKENTL